MNCAYVLFQVDGIDGRCSHAAVTTSAPGVPLCRLHDAAGPGPTRVYLLLLGQYVKIGYSADPEGRVRSIMRDRTIVPPDAVGIPVLLTSVPGDIATERLLHTAFAAYRVEGEWFRREGLVEKMVEAVTDAGAGRVLVDPPLIGADL